jgi:hypothetical protein
MCFWRNKSLRYVDCPSLWGLLLIQSDHLKLNSEYCLFMVGCMLLNWVHKHFSCLKSSLDFWWHLATDIKRWVMFIFIFQQVDTWYKVCASLIHYYFIWSLGVWDVKHNEIVMEIWSRNGDKEDMEGNSCDQYVGMSEVTGKLQNWDGSLTEMYVAP